MYFYLKVGVKLQTVIKRFHFPARIYAQVLKFCDVHVDSLLFALDHGVAGFSLVAIPCRVRKGRFTRYRFVVCDKLTTSLRHESFRVNLTYNLVAIVAYDTKNVVGF